MKNTSRISRNSSTNRPASQTKTLSIPGQPTATISHQKFDTAGKVTFGALRIGEAIGLSEDEIKGLAALAAWERVSPEEYCRFSVLNILKTSFEEAQIIIREGDAGEGLEITKKMLFSLPPTFQRLMSYGNIALGPTTTSPETEPTVQQISQNMADEARRALDELDRAGAAAVSLLIMVAETLSNNMGAYSPQNDDAGLWKQIEGFEFGDAMPALAVEQIKGFHRNIALWREAQLSMISGRCQLNSESLELSILEMSALLRLQADLLDRHFSTEKGTCPSTLATGVLENLWSSYNKSLHFYSKLIEALKKNSPALGTFKTVAADSRLAA